LELDDGQDGTGRDGNLITLCRHCHWRVGHLRINWSDGNPDIRLMLDGVGQRIYEARQARLREIAADAIPRLQAAATNLTPPTLDMQLVTTNGTPITIQIPFATNTTVLLPGSMDVGKFLVLHTNLNSYLEMHGTNAAATP